MSLFPSAPHDAGDHAGADTDAVEDSDGWDNEWEDDSTSTETQADLVKYIAYVLWYARLPVPIFFGALYLLQKRRDRDTNAKVPASQSLHALFLTAFIIANDLLNDKPYGLPAWRKVGSYRFALREMADAKLEFCFAMDWRLLIREAPLERFMRRLGKKGVKECRTKQVSRNDGRAVNAKRKDAAQMH